MNLAALLSKLKAINYQWIYRYKSITIGASLIALCSIRYIYCKLSRKRRSLPNGPIGIPIFGSLFSFGLNQRNFLKNRAKRDGELSCFYFSAFGKPVIMINNASTAQFILSHKHCQDRERRTDAFLLNWPDPQSFGDVNGDEWRCRRKLFQKHLLSAMNNNAFFDQNISKYVDSFFDAMDKNKQKTIYPFEHINYVMMMNIYQNIFGGHIEPNSKIFKDLFDSISKFPDILGIFIVLSSNIQFPALFKWLDYKLGYTQLFKVQFERFNESLSKFVGFTFDLDKNEILPKSEENIKQLMDKQDNECVFSEYLIKECYKKTQFVDTRRIMMDFVIIFVAGTHTTSVTAQYMMHLLGTHYDIQQRLYQELDTVIDGEFKIKDVNNMPLLRAFVYESVRLTSAATVSVPRILSEDIEYKSYILPKGSTIFTNMDSCNVYAEVWNKEKQIDLSHWLDDDGQFRMNNNLSVFGFGERQCPGKLLATKFLMYLCARIVLNYKVKSCTECKFVYGGLTKSCNELGFDVTRRKSRVGGKRDG